MMIINDTTSWNITQNSSIMLQELPITHIENISSTGITSNDNRNMFVVQATDGKTMSNDLVKEH
jgi:hypothetical protein